MFFQEFNGVLTGDLIDPISNEYISKRSKLLEDYNKAKGEEKKKLWKEFKDWCKDNEDTIDFRLLIPRLGVELTDAQKKKAEEHKKHIISLIGEKQFDRHMNYIEDNIDAYESMRAIKLIELQSDPNLIESGVEAAMEKFDHEFSPYIELDRKLGKLDVDGNYGSHETYIGSTRTYAQKGLRGIVTIPKEKDANNKQLNWYDKKYVKIRQNAELLDFYNYITDLMDYMKTILPADQQRNISSTTMPLIMKSMTTMFLENSGLGMAELINKIQSSLMVGNDNESASDEINLATGALKKNIKLNANMSSNKIFKNNLELKIIELENNKNRKATEKEIEAFKVEVYKEMNQTRSFDLPSVLKMYVAAVITHKHKSNVVDAIDLAREHINSIPEIVESRSGEVQMNENGLRVQSGLKNLKATLDYQIDIFKNHPIHSITGKSKEKTYTKLEKSKLGQLLMMKDSLEIRYKKNLISRIEYNQNLVKIDNAINNLGGYVAMSAIGENLLKYQQMRGMGFNVIAGGINLTTG